MSISSDDSRPRASIRRARLAAHAGLVYVSDEVPGIERRRRGKTAFVYYRGHPPRPVSHADRNRIRALAIPPAYHDVWICPNPRGHLQATGRDARGRKQYRYHAAWRAARDDQKFDRITQFAAALPRLRRRVTADLALAELPADKVIALIVRLLDTTRVRVGNAEYERDNGTYGLTTLRDRHVSFPRGGGALIQFRGKGGAPHVVRIGDRRLVSILRSCRNVAGSRLFQSKDPDGTRRTIGSAQVNAYLRRHMGDRFTAKDFRTWSATLRAIRLLDHTPLPQPPTQRAVRTVVNEVVRAIAAEMRNTPAVCRRSYICPSVFDAWRNGRLASIARRYAAPRGAGTRTHGRRK